MTGSDLTIERNTRLAAAPQGRLSQRYLFPVFILGVVLAIGSLFIGIRDMTISGLLSGENDHVQILAISRIPRLVAIMTAGAGMSVAGLIMQQLARNKFVSPSTTGTVESAGLGILLISMFFPSTTMLQKMAVGFVFALAGAFIFMQMLDRIKYKDVIFVPLLGIMFGGVIGSAATFIAYRYDLLQSLSGWMTGSFAGVLRGRYELLYVAVITTALAYVFADRFTLAGMGEDFAVNLGLKYKQVVNIGLALIALTTSAVMLTVGNIPFLGLIIPNVVTIMLGDNLKGTLPFTALLGIVFLLICDIIGRTIRYPYEIPISLIVGVIGSGIFLYLIMRKGAYAPK